ncbi:MAG: 16S rRNA (guanine(966)-N(2))-methyltransferase RsmD [Bacillati bacterium ANGP1]|uniref:16S rRNA (Guanine(966)-N(2))-methyltransferase RsmD n=1 Tax=Candidatus Segetimicrobium genomatis TaxID=2569760 RepID=A0A537JAT4_9BACT|nr:MAG: 16S rRNA (guanine(966)-N(2))-methyltransferase RsmD [Terrabacteria group bacterium ANGP1]
MRLSGGTARGRHLRARGSRGVRPTATRVKDAVFNSLGPRVADARVLDLFAGTGGLGMEALSRGAREAVFVERDPRNAAAIRENLAAAGLGARGAVRRGNALTAVMTLAAEGQTFDFIILDPPYGRGLARETLGRVAATTLLAEGGVAIAEGHWRDDPGQVPGLERVRESRYGETAVWIYAKAAKKEAGV